MLYWEKKEEEGDTPFPYLKSGGGWGLVWLM